MTTLNSTSFPKHFIQIRDRIIEGGENISIDEDIDRYYNIVTFTINENSNSLNVLDSDGSNALFSINGFLGHKKYDRVKIFYNNFPDNNTRLRATVNDCVQVFDGYIDEIIINENKTEGINIDFTCKSTFGLIDERTTFLKSFNDTLNNIFVRALKETGVIDVLPYVYIQSNLANTVFMVPSDNNFGEVVNSLKRRYPLRIFQTGDGGVWITTNSFFEPNVDKQLNVLTTTTNSQQGNFVLRFYEYTLNENVFNINYGDRTNDVNTVLVVGMNTSGASLDIVGFEEQYGDLQNNLSPELLSVRTIYRRDITNPLECRKLAQETLLNILQNRFVELDTFYLPVHQIGDLLRLKDSKVIPNNVSFLIKRRNVTINKQGIDCKITAVRISINDILFDNSLTMKLEELLRMDVLGLQGPLTQAAIQSNIQ